MLPVDAALAACPRLDLDPGGLRALRQGQTVALPEAEQAGKLRIGKINIDENLELARRFDVMSIPTMILFKDGEPQLRIVGAKPKGQLLQELQPYL